MELIGTETGTITDGNIQFETWIPTCNLRWKQPPLDSLYPSKTLQQMWQSSQGNQKWEDIKTVILTE